MDTNAATLAWIQMFRAYRRAREQADSTLKTNDLPPLEQYDILLELERAGQTGLRPMVLEKRLLLPQYGISRLVDRMRKAQLIENIPCPEDRRGYNLRITETGQELRRQMWQVYGPVISAATSDLTKEEGQLLADLLQKVAMT